MRENHLLQHVYTANAGLTEKFPGVTIPPGDDMGAINFGDSSLLIAVDQVSDGVHFNLADTPIEKIGRKAITRNLSDVAAMAARPTAAVVAVSLPRGFGEGRSIALFDAMRTTAEVFGCPLIGGDISMWDGPLLVSVTVFAQPWTDDAGQSIAPVERRGAQPGDAIYVTGELGFSFPTNHHLDFTPRLDLAHYLVTTSGGAFRPTAMIDLSDGIAQDLPRLVEHAELHARILPIRETIAGDPVSEDDAWRHALGDGEDYELLFTAPPSPEGVLFPDAFGDEGDEDHETDKDHSVLITRIGTVTDAGGIVVQTPNDERLALAECFPSDTENVTADENPSGGWEHCG